MKREADGDMGSPQKRTRRGDEEVRLLIPSKVSENSFIKNPYFSGELFLLFMSIFSSINNIYFLLLLRHLGEWESSSMLYNKLLRKGWLFCYRSSFLYVNFGFKWAHRGKGIDKKYQ